MVKKVIITSSFAAVTDASKGNWPERTYSEADWNPMTHEEALSNPARGYTGKSTATMQHAYLQQLPRKTTRPSVAQMRKMMEHINVSVGSKAFAEKAAWEFVEKERPTFSLSTIEPTLVFGPIVSLPQKFRN